MKVTMLLADAAQVAEGKLNVLGGGWAVTGPDPSPSAIAVLVEVPWDQTNAHLEWTLELVDSDGHPVTAQDEPIVLTGGFEVGRPAGIRRGTPIGVPLALNLGPLPLAPDGRYEWRFSIDGQSREDWRLAFSTRPIAPSGGGS